MITRENFSLEHIRSLQESSKYANTIDKNIDCGLLLTEPEYLQVKVPDVNSILADKLTAFAPHTRQ